MLWLGKMLICTFACKKRHTVVFIILKPSLSFYRIVLGFLNKEVLAHRNGLTSFIFGLLNFIKVTCEK